MLKKSFCLFVSALVLSACASSQPRIIQPDSNVPDIQLSVGLATQIEMPDQGRVQSVVVGNPSLVSAEAAGDVVSLIAKGGTGETNLIIRAREDGDTKVYQYRVTVQ
ncbi:MAG: pilus assembly protein N-terminal domain-containing protein [Bdellovibrionales bacterium]